MKSINANGQQHALAALARSVSIGLTFLVSPATALAAYDVNIAAPASPISSQIYGLHMYILYVCAAIFVVVFALMFYSIFKFRRSNGSKPDVNFHESTLIEIIWTVIPFVILLFMAIPATNAEEVGFYSSLSTPWSQIGQPGEKATEEKGKDYLLEVDNPMVVPVGKRVRLLVTSNDVIHGWYVPQLGVNQYGIPGFVKDVWFKADKVGTFKGQCSQICGKLHGYMPITVVVKSEADYAKWVAEAKTRWGVTPVAAAAATPAAVATPEPGKPLTLVDLKAAGEKVYAANCVTCHQASGKGMPPTFPALSGSKVVLGPTEGQINILLNGKPGTAMASFARLSDFEIAAVMTYTKNSWDNSTGKFVTPDDIKAKRKS